MSETIDVNLTSSTSCDCTPTCSADGLHHRLCSRAPVIVRSFIPRSVRLIVGAGECNGSECYGNAGDLTQIAHGPDCPARPVEVMCTIGGNAWSDSRPMSFVRQQSGSTPVRQESIRKLCRARWDLIVAVLLHRGPVAGHQIFTAEAVELLAERDRLFPALMDTVKAEQAAWDAQCRAVSAIDTFHRKTWHMDPAGPFVWPPSADLLSVFVDDVVQRIGATT